VRLPRPSTNHRPAVVATLEALEVGNTREAVALLQGMLEDGPVCDPHGRRRPCDVWGWGPAWPGLIADHRRRAHPEIETEAA
jgi:hypothetical protein